MPGAQGASTTSSDVTTTLSQINTARAKYGLGALTLTNTAAGGTVSSAHIDSMKTSLQQAITTSGSGHSLTTVINYEVGKPTKATLLQTLYDTAVGVYNYCTCNCNNCGCNYCTCNCDNCGCDYCTCNCDNCYYCTCNCDNCYSCSCDGSYCTCDCDHDTGTGGCY